MADVVALWLLVMFWLTLNTKASPKSRYSLTAKWAVGCAVAIVPTTVVAFDLTLPMAGPMLPVVSARNTTSGFGGIVGVWTVLFTVIVSP